MGVLWGVFGSYRDLTPKMAHAEEQMDNAKEIAIGFRG